MLKWLVPFFMISAFISNIALTDAHFGTWTGSFYGLLQVIQAVFYMVAMIGYNKEGGGLKKIPTFFCLSNLGIFKAWIEYAMGKRYVSWAPTKR